MCSDFGDKMYAPVRIQTAPYFLIMALHFLTFVILIEQILYKCPCLQILWTGEYKYSRSSELVKCGFSNGNFTEIVAQHNFSITACKDTTFKILVANIIFAKRVSFGYG